MIQPRREISRLHERNLLTTPDPANSRDRQAPTQVILYHHDNQLFRFGSHVPLEERR
jgi:hypothetical protein